MCKLAPEDVEGDAAYMFGGLPLADKENNYLL